MIEHLFDPIKLIAEAKKVLKKEGVLILTTPNIAYILRRIALLFGKFPENVSWARTHNTDEWEHIRFFTLSSLENILDISGFEIIKCDGIGRLSKIHLTLFSIGFVIKAIKKD